MSGERQTPFFCPYCGDEDLVPVSDGAGVWTCRSCARAFRLRAAGLDPAALDAAGLRSEEPS